MVQPEGRTGGSCSIETKRRVTMEMSVGEASATYPGLRFTPTDEELIQCYLKKKLHSSGDDVDIIPEVDICKHEPWDLPDESIIPSDREWYFFTARGKKYPSGSQNKRATAMGYWKATGKERSVKLNGNIIGTKRTLVFHKGRAPRGQRTEWIMHEFCSIEENERGIVVCRLRKNKEFHTVIDSRDESAIDINATGGEQSQMEGIKLSGGEQSLEGIQLVGCDSSYNSHELPVSESSYNSHSIELPVSEESDEKNADERIFDGSSSLTKTNIEEDDCYTDIMKDDIIKLDDENFGDTLRSEIKHMTSYKQMPSQGTAPRRIRLRQHKSFRRKPSKFQNEVIASIYQRSFIAKIKYPSIFVFSLILSVVVWVVGWNGFQVLGYYP